MGNMMFALACICVLISPSVYTFFFLLTSELWKSLSTVFIIESAYLTAVSFGKTKLKYLGNVATYLPSIGYDKLPPCTVRGVCLHACWHSLQTGPRHF